uniref:Dynein assembly factor 1, axonemal n=1 Tax=Anthurium amnicola TaxID=1678845 RepID=A0A1D1XS88_9ARAE
MAKVHCFSALLVGKKKKSKDSPKVLEDVKANRNRMLSVKLESVVYPSGEKGMEETSFAVPLPFGTQGEDSTCNVKVLKDDHLDVVEGAYEGGDEHDEISSMRRDFSDFDLQAKVTGQADYSLEDTGVNGKSTNDKCEGYEGVTAETVIQSGHVSDPGIRQKTTFWGSPRLKRSCSNIETRVARRLPVSPSKSLSYDDLQNLSGNVRGEVSHEFHGSPFSVMTPCSADRVMLKKKSSSQVLPSRSRKLWWRLFLWSHRNMHMPWISTQQRKHVPYNDLNNPKGGYSSDTLEPSHALAWRNKKGKEVVNDSSRTDLWPQNQWVAFAAESSSLHRVDAWVNSLEDTPYNPFDYDEDYDGQGAQSVSFLNSPEVGESSGKNQHQSNRRLAEEVLQANHIIRSLNSLSSVAHISGMGLKVIPIISVFSSLRAVNLSDNSIVHISPGALPKSLHTLDLSRNKIATIEGLRELTRLRVLNLSYNRISRIGHGLSNCTLIKELYLAGNKISNVEGLHRLLKLSVLDLSFNKITTAKALGQLVANYNSLLALNLLGNPIQSNIGDDHLRKAVSGLLPQLTYLNKQPVKPQRAREAATDNIAKAALGNSGWGTRRKSVRRTTQGSSSSVRGRTGDVAGHRGPVGGGVSRHRKSRHGSKSKHSPSFGK